LPAHGWNIKIWAREVTDIIENLRIMIASNGEALPRKMRPCCYPLAPIAALPPTPCWSDDADSSDGPLSRVICDCTGRTAGDARYMWHGYIVERAYGREPEVWSLGTYKWVSHNTIKITELPLCVWSKPFVSDLEKITCREGSFIKNYVFAPSDEVEISVTFNTASESFAALGIEIGALGSESPADLNDPIIAALHLRNRMNSNLNFMMPDDSVRTFDSYEEVISYWFPIRRAYYARRIARLEEIHLAWIEYYESVIRYIEVARKQENRQIAIAKMSTKDSEKALRAAGFVPLNLAFLRSPEIKFEVAILAGTHNSGASFDYILDLRERDVTIDGCAIFERRLAEQRSELAALREAARVSVGCPFVGARIWMRELDLLVERINRGRATEWQFDEYGKYSFA
jgi:hypothetical protein